MAPNFRFSPDLKRLEVTSSAFKKNPFLHGPVVLIGKIALTSRFGVFFTQAEIKSALTMQKKKNQT